MAPIAFPFKLWDVIEKGSADLIKWSPDGKSILVNIIGFDEIIVLHHPRFLRSPNLECLQKMLYHYEFRPIPNNIRGVLQYWHPLFHRGRKSLLPQITTRPHRRTRDVVQPESSDKSTTADGHVKTLTIVSRYKRVNSVKPRKRKSSNFAIWKKTGQIVTALITSALPEQSVLTDALVARDNQSSSKEQRSDIYGEDFSAPPDLFKFLSQTGTSLKKALQFGDGDKCSRETSHSVTGCGLINRESGGGGGENVCPAEKPHKFVINLKDVSQNSSSTSLVQPSRPDSVRLHEDQHAVSNYYQNIMYYHRLLSEQHRFQYQSYEQPAAWEPLNDHDDDDEQLGRGAAVAFETLCSHEYSNVNGRGADQRQPIVITPLGTIKREGERSGGGDVLDWERSDGDVTSDEAAMKYKTDEWMSSSTACGFPDDKEEEPMFLANAPVAVMIESPDEDVWETSEYRSYYRI